jgi:hypothetical protein
MSSEVISTAANPSEPIPSEQRTARRTMHPASWPGVLLSFAVTSMTVGIIWDISWHITIGRDTFWTPAHMAIYLGGALGGMTAGWLAFKCTFLARREERDAWVSILGARAPLGAWVTIWGAVAMLTSAPFDDWWHNAYGLDVRIVSPPHALLGLGMLGLSLGALLLTLAHQNRVQDGTGNVLFIYVAGIFLALGAVFVMEFTTPNLQHAAPFYKVCALAFAFRLAAIGVAGRMSWPATRAAAVCMGIGCLMTWILPLFPGQPKLAPIFNPVTHMVPPAFPLLLIFPALGIDLILRKTDGAAMGWRRVRLALLLGAVFFLLFLAVQWTFSSFLLSPAADNWFFAGNRYWGYSASPGVWRDKFWQITPGPGARPFDALTVLWSWMIASAGCWLGLAWGSWMRKVQR